MALVYERDFEGDTPGCDLAGWSSVPGLPEMKVTNEGLGGAVYLGANSYQIGNLSGGGARAVRTAALSGMSGLFQAAVYISDPAEKVTGVMLGVWGDSSPEIFPSAFLVGYQETGAVGGSCKALLRGLFIDDSFRTIEWSGDFAIVDIRADAWHWVRVRIEIRNDGVGAHGEASLWPCGEAFPGWQFATDMTSPGEAIPIAHPAIMSAPWELVEADPKCCIDNYTIWDYAEPNENIPLPVRGVSGSSSSISRRLAMKRATLGRIRVLMGRPCRC